MIYSDSSTTYFEDMNAYNYDLFDLVSGGIPYDKGT